MKEKNDNLKKSVLSTLNSFRSGPALFSFGLCVAGIFVVIASANYDALKDMRTILGTVFLLLSVYIIFVILQGQTILGKELNNSEKYLLASLTGSYIIGSVIINNLSPGFDGFPVALTVPTALFIMLISVFMGKRPAMIFAVAMPLGAYFAGAFDNY